jgi:sugar phosphate isomerase/epimerase
MRLSVFTACTPWSPLPALLPAVAAAGYQGIEIGLRGRSWDPAKPPNYWGNNPAMLDWTSIADEAPALRADLDRLGLACPCIGSYADTTQRELWPKAVQAARILGAGLVRIRVPGHDAARGYAAQLAETRAAYRDLAALGAAEGLTFLIEIHDRTLCPSPSAAMRVLEGLDPAWVGVIFEPANMAAEGNESLPMAIDLLGPYLRHVHLKDVTLSIRERPDRLSRQGHNFAPLGQGILDWPGIVAALRAKGYAGWLSVENFTGAELGPTRLAADRAWAQAALGI